jgi:hypothetical protein
MKSKVEKTEYFKLGNMTILCLLTLDNGYEIVTSATKQLATAEDEDEARGIAYQRAMYRLVELDSFPQTVTVGMTPTVLS